MENQNLPVIQNSIDANLSRFTGLFFDVADIRAVKKNFWMAGETGKWVGFTVSGLCLAVIWLVVSIPVFEVESLSDVFSRFCHQFTDRCYQVNGVSLPVCVRCIWIYGGFAVGHILFLYWKPQIRRSSQALIGAIGLMLLDVALEWTGLYHNLFWTRMLTGFLFGFVVSRFTLLGLRELITELDNPFKYVRTKFFSGRTR